MLSLYVWIKGILRAIGYDVVYNNSVILLYECNYIMKRVMTEPTVCFIATEYDCAILILIHCRVKLYYI